LILLFNFDGNVADQFAARTGGAPFQEKVPTPGRLVSEEPAIEGPDRMKAKARTKLVMRIIFKSLLLFPSAVRRQFDTSWLFPDLCSARAKWFRDRTDLFRWNATTKHS
jgi:hypothetical protein